jgi:hypothetical protein
VLTCVLGIHLEFEGGPTLRRPRRSRRGTRRANQIVSALPLRYYWLTIFFAEKLESLSTVEIDTCRAARRYRQREHVC